MIDSGFQVEITRISLPIPGLPQSFHGYRIVQLSDLHIGTWLDGNRLARTVRQVNAMKPDLIAFTGDFVTYHPGLHAGELFRGLRDLKARDGSVAVLGNHDHRLDPAAVRRILRSAGVRELKNQHVSIQRERDSLLIAGEDDYMVRRARLDRVLSRLPATGSAILLAHEPDFADTSARTGRFALQLSGHSHGGQVRLPYLGAPILPRNGRKYPAGLYRLGSMWLYTNRGLGTAHLKLRINCPPEIALITLLAPPKDQAESF